MAIILGSQSAADAAYDVANSCRFNRGDSPFLSKTPGSAGNRDRWSYSCWLKRGLLGTVTTIASATAGAE